MPGRISWGTIAGLWRYRQVPALKFDTKGSNPRVPPAPNENPVIPCFNCPLQAIAGLRPLSESQLAYMQDFKQGELYVGKGAIMLSQGSVNQHLYTLLQGVVFRFRMLEDGRRQITNYLFPGDLIGLQGAMDEPLAYGIEAVTPARICLFVRERILELFATHPKLGFDVAWLTAKEESSLDEHLMAVGRRTAAERLAYLALFLFLRGRATGLATKTQLKVSLTQPQIADTVGLSIVHTNKTLQALRRSKLIEWTSDHIGVPDLEKAIAYAKYDLPLETARPFI
jgi:CRP/FNR family transcriptional regulator, anaerobic regulatory protein